MNKFLAIVQIIASAVVLLMALATMVNLFFISMRPETISVVNTMVGQGVLIIILLVLSRVLFRRGRTGFKEANAAADSESTV